MELSQVTPVQVQQPGERVLFHHGVVDSKQLEKPFKALKSSRLHVSVLEFRFRSSRLRGCLVE